MKIIINIILLAFVSPCCYAQNIVFDAASIPEQLKKNAYSVKRAERINFDIKAINKASYKVHKVVTILNENGKDELEFHEFTDKFVSLESVQIQLFDARGAVIRKYKKSDLIMQSSGEGLVPDGKVFYIEFPAPAYPLTIQVDYELKLNGLLNYPRYQVQMPEQSVESSIYTATVPTDLDLRFKGINTTILPSTTDDGKIKTYSWSIKNLPALEYEVGAVSYASRYPHILISPNKFELDNYEGDMTTWKNFGKWYGLLAKSANNLTDERKQFFQSLVKDAPNDRDKIKIIYTYLQSNCRYVLISLGIGGFKPFDANFVDKKKYGDCKALSNYAQACLSAIDIKSYQALINSDYNKSPVDPAFPYNGFNHVILCIPNQKDTIWLECTSNTAEFGVLGNFTENKYALLIAEDGGKLVPTPKSNALDNVFSSNSLVELAEDNSGTVTVHLQTTGAYRQDFANYLDNQKKDEQKKFLVNYIGYPEPDDFDIIYDLSNKKDDTKITMSLHKIPEFTAGKKVFLNPRIYKIWGSDLPKSDGRTQDFYFEHPFIKTDTTSYHLPDGYTVESIPEAKEFHNNYCSFSSSYTYDETKRMLQSVVKLELNEFKIPVAKYSSVKNFFNEVLKEYTGKLVIKRL